MSKNDECWVKPEKGIWIERLLLISHSEKKYSEPMKKNGQIHGNNIWFLSRMFC